MNLETRLREAGGAGLRFHARGLQGLQGLGGLGV